MSNIVIGITFWIVIGIITVASLLLSYLKNLEFQKTIRFAIDKGIQLDSKSIENLIRKKTGKPMDYYISGILCFSCFIGLLFLSPYISKIEHKVYSPIIGSGILVGVIGIGLALCGFLLEMKEKKEKKGD